VLTAGGRARRWCLVERWATASAAARRAITSIAHPKSVACSFTDSTVPRAIKRHKCRTAPHTRQTAERLTLHSHGRGRLQLLHLVEGASDANRLPAEVDRYRARLDPRDATHPIRVVADHVGNRIVLDSWLGLALEGATGEMSPPCPGWRSHLLQVCACRCFAATSAPTRFHARSLVHCGSDRCLARLRSRRPGCRSHIGCPRWSCGSHLACAVSGVTPGRGEAQEGLALLEVALPTLGWRTPGLDVDDREPSVAQLIDVARVDGIRPSGLCIARWWWGGVRPDGLTLGLRVEDLRRVHRRPDLEYE